MGEVRPGELRPAGHAWWRADEWWYLGFLVMLVFQPAFDPGSGTLEWLVTGATVAMFVPLYFAIQTRPGRLQRWAPAVSAALGVAVFPFNGGATVLLVYAAAFAGAHHPRRTAFRWFAGLSALTVALAVLTPMPLPFALLAFGVPILFVWVVGLSVIEEVERDRERERLRIDNARIEHLATATERDRIARDLHDLLGQSLTEVIVRAQLVRRLAATDPERAVQEGVEIERSSRRALDEVRAAVRGWREIRIDEELEVARRALVAAGVDLAVERDPTFDPPPTTETALGLVLREAVTNVVRHAGASQCAVTLRREDGYDVLEVADDGAGSDGTEGGGLAGMRERVLALGGHFERAGDHGTRISVRIPAGVPA